MSDNFPEILDCAIKLRNYHRRHNKTVNKPLAYEKYSDFLNIINKNNTLKNNFSIRDLADFFMGMGLSKSLFKLSPTEFESELKRYLYRNPSKNNYFFRVQLDHKFVDGKQVGFGKVISFSSMPIEAKDMIRRQYRFEHNKKPWPSQTGTDYEKLRENDYYMQIAVTSRGMDYGKNQAIKYFHQSEAIFYFFTLSSFSDEEETESVYCALDEQNQFLASGPGSDEVPSPRIRSFYSSKIEDVNKILNKSKTNEIEQNILRAIYIVGSIESRSQLELAFIFCIQAMESLLTGTRRGDLRYKTSERMAFLLADNEAWLRYYKKITVNNRKKLSDQFIRRHLIESRKELFHTINTVYDYRSKFVHLENEQHVDENDYYLAKLLLLLLVEKLFELLNSNITHANSKSQNDVESIEHIVNELKFK